MSKNSNSKKTFDKTLLPWGVASKAYMRNAGLVVHLACHATAISILDKEHNH